MKKLLSCSMVMAFLCFAGPQESAAQGWGGFWNYMNKLSGPRVTGPGLHVYTAGGERDLGLVETPQVPGFAGSPFRFRLDVGLQRSISSDDAIDPDGSSITMLSARLAVERELVPHLDLGIGGALNWFFGDFDDTFQHPSGRIYAQGRIPLGNSGVDLTPGLALYVWPKFDTNDFAPLVVDVDRTSTEVTWGLFVGVDIPF